MSRLCVERFARPAYDDGDAPAHALAIGPAPGKNVLTGFARHRRETHAESIVAVQRDAEVAVKGEKRVCDAWEEFRESERFGTKGCKGAVTDDAVGVVAENVFPGRRQFLGAVETGGKVGCEERPDWETTEPVGSVAQVAGCAGFGEEDVDQVGEEYRP